MGITLRQVSPGNIPMVCFLQAAAEAGLPSSLQFDAERSRAGCPLGAWRYPRRDDSLDCAFWSGRHPYRRARPENETGCGRAVVASAGRGQKLAGGEVVRTVERVVRRVHDAVDTEDVDGPPQLSVTGDAAGRDVNVVAKVVEHWSLQARAAVQHGGALQVEEDHLAPVSDDELQG